METLKLTQDFKEFLSLLNSSRIEYLLIGGYAVGLYGHLRPTKDIDFWVATNEANLSRLRATLEDFGFTGGIIPTPMFQPPRTTLRMGVPPNRLEILSEIAGVAFDECYARRQRMTIDGIEADVISLSDLKMNKSAAGRAQDLADVQKLEKNVG